MIRIGQAASSETFGKFGTPPNQRRTGVTADKPGGNLDGELNIQPFYTGNWQAVFRCKDPKIAERAATILEKAVANGSKVGYGQNWLNDKYPLCGLFDALYKMADPDPWKIEVPVNCTCATLVGAAYYFAGLFEPKLRLLNTYEQEEVLMNTGGFVKLSDPLMLTSAKGVQRGDILWRVGHTAMILDTDCTLLTTPYKCTNCVALNLREGPSTEYDILGTLAGGEIVYVISWNDNGWAQVKSSDGQMGYVSPKYITKLPKADATGNTWLREEPGTDGKQIIVIPKGQKCFLTGNAKTVGLRKWYEVIYAGNRGWASSLYIKP